MPVFGVSSITSPYHAEDALAKGQCDLVLMARQLFADPEFANKALEGRSNDIRPCVRYNFCASRAPFRPGCFQNVVHGREKLWGFGTIKKVAQPKGVIVIGGGPAGLEAALVAAERGHHVVLYEKETQLGGRLRLQARLPLQYEFGNLIAWYEHRLRKLQVPVHLGKEVTRSNLASVLDQQDPDAAVVATGSRSAPTGFVGIVGGPIPGSDTRMALSYEDVVTGKAQVGSKVVLFDNFSNELAVGLALLLAGRGHEVLLVTPYNDVEMDQYTNRALRSVHMEEVAKYKNLRLLPHTYVKRIGERTVTLAHTFSSREWVEEGVDSVVPLVHFEPHNELYSEIKGKVKETYIIGDALNYRHVHDAFLEGHRVGRKL